jgi:exopolyphosphatase / guanosine-5'-triphosphate,3'-diphosphate pyrophosphatase
MVGSPRPGALRVAAIDIGTNTALLLIAETTGDGLEVASDEERFVRLGEGVDGSGAISAAALTRLLETLHEYSKIVDAGGVERLDVVATSAFRDAANREEVALAVHEEIGFKIRPITGNEEAILTFEGGVSRLAEAGNRHVTIDIGGGSTEISRGHLREGRARLDRAVSTRCGAIRISERFFREQPPRTAEVRAAEDFIDAELIRLDGLTCDVLVGTSGTTHALVGLEGRLPAPRRPVSIDRESVDAWSLRLLALSYSEVLDLNPALMTGRADAFPAGILVLSRVMHRVGATELAVSDGGLRHGVAWRLAAV